MVTVDVNGTVGIGHQWRKKVVALFFPKIQSLRVESRLLQHHITNLLNNAHNICVNGFQTSETENWMFFFPFLWKTYEGKTNIH